MKPAPGQQFGFTLIELLITTLIAMLVITGLAGVLQSTSQAKLAVKQRIEMNRRASFAIDRMAMAVSESSALLLPLDDKASTNWPENVRNQTVPASPPQGDSTLATAVLAVALPAYSDIDMNGVPDADNDGDGRINEDPGADRNNDASSGIFLVDDSGDGDVDEGVGSETDDDEWLADTDEDPVNGIDDDGDGNVDEDAGADQNGDGCPGICGVDDDGDGSIDEGDPADDDEDGNVDEDWLDPHVFYLDGSVLKERVPVPWDESGGDGVNGRDFLVFDLAEDVTQFRVEKVLTGSEALPLVDITLALEGDGDVVTVNRRVRLGGAR